MKLYSNHTSSPGPKASMLLRCFASFLFGALVCAAYMLHATWPKSPRNPKESAPYTEPKYTPAPRHAR